MRATTQTTIASSGILAATLLFTACADDPSTPAARVAAALDAAPGILGHRGVGPTRSGNGFAENSMPSFEEALRRGADGVELDVGLAADGTVVVLHDDTLDRTTTCSGCLSTFTREQLASCFLLDGDDVPLDITPPTLREVFATLGDSALINVELKVAGDACGANARELAQAALGEVLELGVENRTLFSSFDLSALEAVKEQAPDVYAAHLLAAVSTDDIDAATARGLDAIHPLQLIDAPTVAAARAAGLQVNMWTPNSNNDLQASIEKGATALITDHPERAAALR